MIVIYHPLAETELTGTAVYYNRKVPGLGERFLHEFDAAITTILKAPQRWPIVDGDIQRFVMPRFPFGIYYRVQEDKLRILVVKHHARHPDYGKERWLRKNE